MMDGRQAMQLYLDQRLADHNFVTPIDVNQILLEFIEQSHMAFCQTELAAGATVEQVNAQLKPFTAAMEVWRKEALSLWARRTDEPFAPSHAAH